MFVYFNTKAKKITIGDNVKIGANATVVKNIRNNVTIIPAQCRMLDNK